MLVLSEHCSLDTVAPGLPCRGMSCVRDDGGGQRGDGLWDVESDAGGAASRCPARPTCVVASAWRISAIRKDVIGSATGAVVHVPPPADDVPELMRALVQWMNHPHDGHSVIASAVAPFQLVQIRRFLDGSGGTLRLNLYQPGYDVKLPLAVSEYDDRDRTASATRPSARGGCRWI